MPKRLLQRAVWAGLALLPLSCGNGGTPVIALTQGNAVEVAGGVVGSTNFLQAFTALVINFAEVLGGNGESGEFPCDIDGTVAVVVNDTPPVDEASAGDSATFTFNSCTLEFDGEPVTLTGSIAIGLTAIAPAGADPPTAPYDLTLRFDMRNVGLDLGDTQLLLNGVITVQYGSDDGIHFETTILGSSFTARITDIDGVSEARLSDFDLARTDDTSTGAYTLQLDGTIYDSLEGGEVTWATLATFTGMGDSSPEGGVLLVTGSGGSKLRLTALPMGAVRLEGDTDGDETYDYEINTTWAALID